MGHVFIDGKEVWKKGRKSVRNCKALEGEKWILETYATPSWMDSYKCLEATQSSICYEDLVISYPHSGSQAFSIRFETDPFGGLPRKSNGKGWGISHFSGTFTFSFFLSQRATQTIN